MNLLNRSGVDEIGPDTRRILEKIERTCDAAKPRRSKFTVRDDKHFNHIIYADIFYTEGKSKLHIVDQVSCFQAPHWLENVSSETWRKALRRSWIDVYIGTLIEHCRALPFSNTADLQHYAKGSIEHR